MIGYSKEQASTPCECIKNCMQLCCGLGTISLWHEQEGKRKFVEIFRKDWFSLAKSMVLFKTSTNRLRVPFFE